MHLRDYVIDHAGYDFRKILRSWRWLLPRTVTVWMVNRFGEFILIFDDGSVHYLDIGCGTLKPVAESRDHFAELIDQGNNADDWLMIPLVDQCIAAGLTLGPGQCYGFRQLPALGGDYTLDNVMVAMLSAYVQFAALVHKQISDLPDGTRLEIEFAPDA